MSVIIKRSTIAVVTCRKMHDHGQTTLKATYQTQSPLTFNVFCKIMDSEGHTLSRISYEFYREAVNSWLLHAPAGSLLELGQASLKVRLSAAHVVTIKFPEVQLSDSDFHRPGIKLTPMVMVSREWLQRFLADSYVAVPAEFETDQLDIDGCIAKILEDSK